MHTISSSESIGHAVDLYHLMMCNGVGDVGFEVSCQHPGAKIVGIENMHGVGGDNAIVGPETQNTMIDLADRSHVLEWSVGESIWEPGFRPFLTGLHCLGRSKKMLRVMINPAADLYSFS